MLWTHVRRIVLARAESALVPGWERVASRRHIDILFDGPFPRNSGRSGSSRGPRSSRLGRSLAIPGTQQSLAVQPVDAEPRPARGELRVLADAEVVVARGIDVH